MKVVLKKASRPAAWVLFAVLACLTSCTPAPSAGHVEVLQDTELPVATLAQGFQLEVRPKRAGHVLVEVSQENVDVQLSLTVAGSGTRTFDAPARRAAPERACVYSGPDGLHLELRTHDRTANSGKKFRLRIAVAEGGGVSSGSTIEAECLESDAARDGGSAQDYQRVAAIWMQRGMPARSAYARLQAAWALTRQSQWQAAFDEGMRARSEFSQLKDSIGEALANLQIAVPRSEFIGSGKNEKGEHTDDIGTMLVIAHDELQSALKAFEAAGLPFFAADASNLLGANYLQQGEFAEAGRLLARAATNFEAAGEPDGALRALTNSAIVVA